MQVRWSILLLRLLGQSAIATPSPLYEEALQRAPVVSRRSAPNNDERNIHRRSGEVPPSELLDARFVAEPDLKQDAPSYNKRGLDDDDVHRDENLERRLGHHMRGYMKSKMKATLPSYQSFKSHGRKVMTKTSRKIDRHVSKKAMRASNPSSFLRRTLTQHHEDQYLPYLQKRGVESSNEDADARDSTTILTRRSTSSPPTSIYRRGALDAGEDTQAEMLYSRHGGVHGGNARYWHVPDSRKTKLKKGAFTALGLGTLGGLMTWGIIKKIKHKKAEEEEKKKADKAKGQPAQPPAQPPAPPPGNEDRP